MIVVYAELWPGGDESQSRPLGSIAIGNATKDPRALLDDYVFEIDEAPAEELGIEGFRATGPIRGHNRRQSVWKLVKRVLDELAPYPPQNT